MLNAQPASGCFASGFEPTLSCEVCGRCVLSLRLVGRLRLCASCQDEAAELAQKAGDTAREAEAARERCTGCGRCYEHCACVEENGQRMVNIGAPCAGCNESAARIAAFSVLRDRTDPKIVETAIRVAREIEDEKPAA